MARTTRDLCQDCWQDENPTEYAPIATRYGPCAECGAEALVVRSAVIANHPRFPYPGWPMSCQDCPKGVEPRDVRHPLPAVVNPDGSPTAFTLAVFGRSAPDPRETGNPAGLPDCACCGMDFYRTADGGCTYCVTRPDGSRPICCRN